MSAISAIYFLDRKGRIIIFRNYRGEVDQDISEGFINEVLELDEVCDMSTWIFHIIKIFKFLNI